ncbi:MAG: oligopeptide transport system ATP-binding protein [Bradymonadia bacterium]|jgi:oligopeptide transport system ATP-binding protein
MSETPILSMRDVKMHFPIREGILGRVAGHVKAVDGVSLDVMPGETLGLVGESGCGKSTLGRAILQLYKPTAGQVVYREEGEGVEEGVDLCTLKRSDMRPYRRKLQMVFQDPFASLNPRMTVGDIIAEPIRVHKLADGEAAQRRVRELMEMCGLNSRFLKRYPHEFSGGQRQRVGIARALAAEPRLIVCDEPISALDVSIQAQIMNLLEELQAELGLTYVFIAHDLAAVRHISDRIAVMYLGRIVELSTAKDLYANPQHPYTQALISAVPIPDPEIEATRERIVLTGDVPSPRNPPSGCRFRTRCPYAYERCAAEVPARTDLPSGFVACHLREEGR